MKSSSMKPSSSQYLECNPQPAPLLPWRQGCHGPEASLKSNWHWNLEGYELREVLQVVEAEFRLVTSWMKLDKAPQAEPEPGRTEPKVGLAVLAQPVEVSLQPRQGLAAAGAMPYEASCKPLSRPRSSTQQGKVNVQRHVASDLNHSNLTADGKTTQSPRLAAGCFMELLQSLCQARRAVHLQPGPLGLCPGRD